MGTAFMWGPTVSEGQWFDLSFFLYANKYASLMWVPPMFDGH